MANLRGLRRSQSASVIKLRRGVSTSVLFIYNHALLNSAYICVCDICTASAVACKSTMTQGSLVWSPDPFIHTHALAGKEGSGQTGSLSIGP